MFRNRWVRRLAVALPVAFVLILGGSVYVRHKTGQQGQERVAAVTARLNATDPRWRFDDIDADRGTLPDEPELGPPHPPVQSGPRPPEHRHDPAGQVGSVRQAAAQPPAR